MAMSTALLQPLETGDADGKHDKIAVLGKMYTYDQLNRLTASTSIEKTMTNLTTFTWVTGATATSKWATGYTYDGNGNMLNMKRTGTGSLYDMDNLTYQYNPNNNQLLYVDDAIGDGAYAVDIDDQDASPDNYKYDLVGNLTRDVSEEIQTIKWTVYGKIKSLTRSSSSIKENLEFEYDALGNRIMKKVIPKVSGQPTFYTYYVRDAQGNIMSTYKRTVAGSTDDMFLMEQHIYGSSRLGYVQPAAVNMESSFTEDAYYYRILGEKRYELVNHLGNILEVISDRRLAIKQSGGTGVDYYEADVIAAQDYDPFGKTLVRKY